MRLLKFAVALALLTTAPSTELSARGSNSPDDPAVKALLAAYVREKHCGKKLSSSGLSELITDAFPTGASPSRRREYVRDMKRRADAAYNSMPKASRQKSVLCPQLEEILSRWLIDKMKHPDRYR